MVVTPGLNECIAEIGKDNGCIYRFDCYAENLEKAKAQALIAFQKYQNEKCGV